VSDDYQRVEAHACPMSSCAALAGSPCRTTKGRVAIQYHTARFRLVPSLAKSLAVPVPAVRRPGSAWVELPQPVWGDVEPAGHVRIGYARASSARQSLDTQLDSLSAAGVTRVFSEKISTRAVARPELDKAVTLARELRSSGVRVTLVVHEHKRLGRGLDLATLAEELKASGIGLEFLTGELQGSHDPSGIVFTVLAALSGMEREYIRDRTLEGHESARRRGKAIGGASVTDDAMLSMALHLREQDMSLRDIADRLVITTGKKKGKHPSPATVMRLLREHDARQATPPLAAEPSPASLPGQHAAPDPAPSLTAAEESVLPVRSTAQPLVGEPAPAHAQRAQADRAAPKPRRRKSSRDASAPAEAPAGTEEALLATPQGLSQRAAMKIVEAAETVRDPDYRETHRSTVRSGATVLGYVSPSYGGASRSGRNGWIGYLSPGVHGPVRKSQQQAAIDVAASWVRVVTAKPRRD
jgi:DNA invertase Pin-like site-specific DNA recombinase